VRTVLTALIGASLLAGCLSGGSTLTRPSGPAAPPASGAMASGDPATQVSAAATPDGDLEKALNEAFGPTDPAFVIRPPEPQPTPAPAEPGAGGQM
jgi:hypothetical protein